MKRASITEAKNNLSALIDSVKGGASVLIMDRGRPVARLEPVAKGDESDDERLNRLVRDGIVRRGHGSGDVRSILASDPPKLESGELILEALLQERREGR